MQDHNRSDKAMLRPEGHKNIKLWLRHFELSTVCSIWFNFIFIADIFFSFCAFCNIFCFIWKFFCSWFQPSNMKKKNKNKVSFRTFDHSSRSTKSNIIPNANIFYALHKKIMERLSTQNSSDKNVQLKVAWYLHLLEMIMRALWRFPETAKIRKKLPKPDTTFFEKGKP